MNNFKFPKILTKTGQKEKKWLKESERKYKIIFDISPEVIVILDKQGKLLDINERLYDWLGYKKQEILGKNLLNLPFLTKQNKIKMIGKFVQRMIGKKILPYDMEFIHKKGGIRIGRIVGTPITNKEGKIIGDLLIINDVTKIKRAEIKAKELDQMKDELISVTSHELRAPLTAIKGYISMILDGDFGPVSSKIKSQLRYVYFSNEKLIKFVADMLSVSRMEQGRIEFKIKTVYLSKIIKSAIEELEKEAQARNLYLVLVKDDPKLKVLADPDKLKEVLINLINNGIKFTDWGGIKIVIEKKLDNKVKMAVVHITDTGTGIKKEEIPLLFQKFQQLGKILSRRPGGTGLGLYITKQLVEKMNGKIWVESKVRKGSTFSFSLPMK